MLPSRGVDEPSLGGLQQRQQPPSLAAVARRAGAGHCQVPPGTGTGTQAPTEPAATRTRCKPRHEAHDRRDQIEPAATSLDAVHAKTRSS